MTTIIKKYLEWQPLDFPPKPFDWNTTYQIMEKVIFEDNVWMYMGHIRSGYPSTISVESLQVPPSKQFGWIKIEKEKS